MPILGCSSSDDGGHSQDNKPIPVVQKYRNPIIATSLPDPSIVKSPDGVFYLFATEDIRNLPIYRSTDLLKWQYVGTAFTDESRPKWNPGGGIWAPDINYVDGKYMLYYSKSTWGGEWTCGLGVASVPNRRDLTPIMVHCLSARISAYRTVSIPSISRMVVRSICSGARSMVSMV